LRIALPFEPRQHLATESPSGFHIVNTEFLHALARHGRSGELLLLAAGARDVAPKLGDEGAVKHTRQLDMLDLVRQPRSPEADVLHDLSCLVSRALTVRGYLAQPRLPLTFVSHGMAVPLSVRTLAFPLLLGGVQPFDALICISHALKRAFERLLDATAESISGSLGPDASRVRYRGRLEVIHWGVDAERFGAVDRGEARAALGIPQDALVLLSIGRVSPVSKADVLPLLGLFRDLRASNPERPLRLVIAGPTDSQGYLSVVQGHAKTLGVAEHVQWLGGVVPAQRYRVHAAADIFVGLNDSVSEGLGLTPLEAMASGVPQVVSDWDGLRDTVVHGETGMLVPTIWADCDDELILQGLVGGTTSRDLWTAQAIATDMAEMRRALQTLIDNPGLRARMGEASRLRAARMFSWKDVIRRYEDLWQELGELARVSPLAPGRLLPEGAHGLVGHNAAEQLAPTTRLKLTAAGERLLTKGEFVPLHGQPPAVEPEGIVTLLGALGARGGGACPLETLEQDTHVTWGSGRTRFLRHVLWLLKFGLLEVERAPAG